VLRLALALAALTALSCMGERDARMAAREDCEPVEAGGGVGRSCWDAVLEMEQRVRPMRTLIVGYRDATRSSVSDVAVDFDLLTLADLRADGVWVLGMHADYVRCELDECAVLASFAPGAELYGTRRSPSGTRELIVHGEEGDVVLDIFDLQSGRRTGRVPAGGWLHRWHNQPISWVSDERVSIEWGAGTYVALALVYDASGRLLLDLFCDSTSRSPDGLHLACWHPPGAPPRDPEQPEIEIFALGAGEPGSMRVPLPPELRGDVEVQDVLWDERGFGVTALVGTTRPDVVRAVFVRLES
jgi:hypothetical protein